MARRRFFDGAQVELGLIPIEASSAVVAAGAWGGLVGDAAATASSGGGAIGTPVNRASGYNNADQTSYATASFTPTDGDILLVWATTSISTGTAPGVTPTATGLTFTPEHDSVWSGTPGVRRSTLHSCIVPDSHGSTTITLTMTDQGSGTTATGCAWFVISVPGADRTDPTADVRGQEDAADEIPSLITMAGSPAASGNRTVAFMAHRADEASTQGSGWTLLGSHNGASSSLGVAAEYKIDAWDSTADFTFATGANWYMIGVEVQVGSGGPATVEATISQSWGGLTGAAAAVTTGAAVTAGAWGGLTGAAAASSIATFANAEAATTSGTGLGAAISTAPVADAGSSTGVANGGTATILVNAGAAAATGAASNATITGVSSAAADAAAATGVAHGPSPSILVNGAAAAATGGSYDATASTAAITNAAADAAAATGAAFAATVTALASASATAAAASGVASGAAAALLVNAVTSTATGTGFVVTPVMTVVAAANGVWGGLDGYAMATNSLAEFFGYWGMEASIA